MCSLNSAYLHFCVSYDSSVSSINCYISDEKFKRLSVSQKMLWILKPWSYDQNLKGYKPHFGSYSFASLYLQLYAWELLFLKSCHDLSLITRRFFIRSNTCIDDVLWTMLMNSWEITCSWSLQFYGGTIWVNFYCFCIQYAIKTHTFLILITVGSAFCGMKPSTIIHFYDHLLV